MFQEAMGLREAEKIALKHIYEHGFLWPAELARLTGLSWYKSDKLLRALKKDFSLRFRRVGRIKLYYYPGVLIGEEI
jgi:hypothetical protein